MYQLRAERALELRKIRKESFIKTYICNNVTIRVTKYGKNVSIYANDMPLRNVHLSENFTFNDVLKQVMFNKIAKYNVMNWSSEYNKTNYYQNQTTVKRNLSIMPIYALLGYVIEYDNKTYTPYDIDTSKYLNEKHDFNIKVLDNDKNKIELKLTVEQARKIKPLASVKTITLSYAWHIQILQNKLKFVE